MSRPATHAPTVALCVAVALASVAPAVAGAQGRPREPASLLRRLAESAGAFRTGEPVWIVAQESFPHHVIGAYPAERAAMEAATEAGRGFHWYGPFVTPPDRLPDGRPLPRAILAGCWKDDITTEWICPAGPARPPFRMEDVREIRLIITPKTGEAVEVVFPVEETSAIIFTLDAFDRFIVPYYTELFGPEYVAALRDSLVAHIGTLVR